MRHKILFAFALIVGCQAEHKTYPPVAGNCSASHPCSSDDLTSSEGSTTTAPSDCAAFIGCMQQCTEVACEAKCASATNSDEQVCSAHRCSLLTDACADGDEQACADVLSCADGGSSTSGASSETTTTDDASTSSTDTTSG